MSETTVAGGDQLGAAKESRALGGYQPGLDGLRAVAMCVMLAYHSELQWARGAFLGLSQFFTLSGFLITSILLRQHEKRGIDLASFWVRRYRRLLPAALLTLGIVVLFGATVANSVQVEEMPGQVTAATFQVANWYFIITEKSYIDLFVAPSPVQHFWSLAVEEQFYLIMPVFLLLVLRRTSSMKVVGGLFAAGALASTAWMIYLYDNGASLDRLYYGTDTRAAELLTGAVLAVVLHRFPLRPGPTGKKVLAVVGVVAFAITAWGLSALPLADGFIWRGGFLAFSLVSAALIVSILSGSGPVVRVLEVAWLAAIGRITYGLYLYHWPIFLWLTEDRTGLEPWPLFGVRMVLTFGIATLSYHFLEMPVRNGSSFGIDGPLRWAIIPTAAVVVIGGAVLVSTRDVVDTDPLAIAPAAMPARVDDRVLDVLVVPDARAAPVVERFVADADGSDDIEVTVAEPFSCSTVVDDGAGPVCENWVEEWPALIDEHDPDVVLLYVTHWETEELQSLAPAGLDGPSLADWTEELLGNGIEMLTARGAPAVWARVPPDLATEVQLQTQPFSVAMTRVSTSRSDMRTVLDREFPEDLALGGAASIAEASTILRQNLELYRRAPESSIPRVLVLGDSASRTMGYGIERWANDTGNAVVWTAATEGCGFADEGIVRELDFREGPVRERCREVDEGWRSQIDEFDPDVVIVLSTVWDLQERKLPAWPDYRRPGDPEFDDYLLGEYREAVDVLASNGAKIVWVQGPCGRRPSLTGADAGAQGPYDTARLRHLNEVLLPRLQAEHPDDVVLYDLFSDLCPAGDFVAEFEGVGEIRPDGIHFSTEGSVWLASRHAESMIGAGSGD